MLSRCVRLPTHGFASVVAFGGDDSASADGALGRGARGALSQLVRGVGVRVSSGHAQGVRSGSWGIYDCVAKTRGRCGSTKTRTLTALARCKLSAIVQPAAPAAASR